MKVLVTFFTVAMLSYTSVFACGGGNTIDLGYGYKLTSASIMMPKSSEIMFKSIFDDESLVSLNNVHNHNEVVLEVRVEEAESNKPYHYVVTVHNLKQNSTKQYGGSQGRTRGGCNEINEIK